MFPPTLASLTVVAIPPSISRSERLGICVETSRSSGGQLDNAEATANNVSRVSAGLNRLMTLCPEGKRNETLRCSTSVPGSSGIWATSPCGFSSSALSPAAAAAPTAEPEDPLPRTLPGPTGAAGVLAASAWGGAADAAVAPEAGGAADPPEALGGGPAASAVGAGYLSMNSKMYSAAVWGLPHLLPSHDFTLLPVRGSIMQMCGNSPPHLYVLQNCSPSVDKLSRCQNKKFSSTKSVTVSSLQTSRFKVCEAKASACCIFTSTHLPSALAFSIVWKKGDA
mmetsp:Transcript_37708/g.94638  ORF Transcript_37708/g.94638 Transcript_37708/m.94638 type:complete len:281 (-) Transcript_37708:314-1156(-)